MYWNNIRRLSGWEVFFLKVKNHTIWLVRTSSHCEDYIQLFKFLSAVVEARFMSILSIAYEHGRVMVIRLSDLPT